MPPSIARTTLATVASAAVSAALAQPPVLLEDAKLVPVGGAPFDRFGRSVALNGTTGVIGAPFSNGAAPESGSAYLFDVMTGQQLDQLIQVRPPGDDNPRDDGFGEDVSIGGDRILIGAPNNETQGTFAGAANLFRASDGTQLDRLLPFSPPPFSPVGSAFGEHVALSADGNRMMIGARGDTGENDQGANGGGGAAYVYDNRSGDVLKLFASDASFADNFGSDVAISDAFAIASAPFDDDNGNDSGSVYVFDPVTGQELAKLLASDGAALDLFGLQLAISDTVAAVAAPFRNSEVGTNTGAVYLFDLISGEELKRITLDDAVPGEQFGFAVAMDGPLLAFGALERVLVYDINVGDFVAELRAPSDPAEELFFGTSVAISGSRVLVGAEGDETNGTRAGAAYVFDLASLGDQPSARVVSIEPGVVPRGPRLQAEVEVVIEDTLGTPVAEAQVVLRVFGDITQVAVGVTGADGQVAVRTRRAAPAPVSYSVCVLTVIADIPYQAADNLETCDTL